MVGPRASRGSDFPTFHESDRYMIAISPARPAGEDGNALDQLAGDTPKAAEAPRMMVVLASYGGGSPALASALQREGTVVLSFENYAQAAAEIDRLRPDLVLVGDRDPGGTPFQFISALQESGNDSVILFLSHCSDWEAVGQALEAGAHDVVCPPHSVSAIMLRGQVQLKRKRAARVLRRSPLNRQISLGGLTVDLATREVSDGKAAFGLSGREVDLLVRLMEAQGDVVSRERLLVDIWGSTQESEAVLDATVHRLRRRLGERLNRPDLVATVRGIGYRLQLA